MRKAKKTPTAIIVPRASSGLVGGSFRWARAKAKT